MANDKDFTLKYSIYRAAKPKPAIKSSDGVEAPESSSNPASYSHY
jgi:hypothetical protein